MLFSKKKLSFGSNFSFKHENYHSVSWINGYIDTDDSQNADGEVTLIVGPCRQSRVTATSIAVIP